MTVDCGCAFGFDSDFSNSGGVFFHLMELDQKLGMSLDQLMKSDADTKKALRSTRTRGRPRVRARARAGSKMDIDKSTPATTAPKHHKKAAVKKTIKTGIAKKSKDVEMRPLNDRKQGRRRGQKNSETADPGIEKIERKPKVVLTSKKQAQKNSSSSEKRTVKISNIPYDVHWRDVKDAFAKVVPVERCDVEKGQAVIVFRSRADAQRAVDTYNGGNMNGRIIKAAFA